MSHSDPPDLYDRIGSGYAVRRSADPRIARAIRERLGDASSVVNVGAGTGSYEPTDLRVVAVEPSAVMISQRTGQSAVVQARAEALPFPDDSFDAAMCVLTLHHWFDRRRGLAECVRVARRRIVVLTWDPEFEDFWLVADYFPDLLALDRTIMPSMDELRSVLGSISIETLPIPADCQDGFLGAYWQRPESYLDPAVRAGMSSFARIPDVEVRAEVLRRDLDSGVWVSKYRNLLEVDAFDVGYRIVTAPLSD